MPDKINQKNKQGDSHGYWESIYADNVYTKGNYIQDKRPLNNQNQAHGYWEVYYPDGTLHFKGLFVNSIVCGLYESYSEDGSLTLKATFLNRKIHGFCEHLEEKFYYVI